MSALAYVTSVEAIFDQLPSPIIVLDKWGRCRYANPALLNQLFVTLHEIRGFGWTRLVHPNDLSQLRGSYSGQHFETAVPIHFAMHPSVGTESFDGHLVNFTSDHGREFIVVTLNNVSGYRWQQERMIEAQEFLERIASASPIVHAVVRLPQMEITWVNRAVNDYFGLSEDQVIRLRDRFWHEISAGENPLEGQPLILGEVRHGDSVSRTFTGRHAMEGVGVYDIQVQAFAESTSGEVTRALVSIFDRTSTKRYEALLENYLLQSEQQQLELELAKSELEALNAQLEHLTLTDPLTGANNRRSLERFLEQSLAQAQRYQRPLSVCVFDLDKFKSINDTYGHGVGDEVLIHTVKVVLGAKRETDFLARTGGEEFTLVMPETSLEQATSATERIRQSLEQADWPCRPVTGSFGVAQLEPDESFESIVERADQALYASKQNGRNQVTVAAA